MKKTQILAIDIGSSKVCSLIAEVQGGVPRIVGVGIAHSRGIEKGAIKSIVATKALKKFAKSSKANGWCGYKQGLHCAIWQLR